MPAIKSVKVIIVGAGPAGIAAAIQLNHLAVPFLIFEKERAGGLLNQASVIENCPLFPAGVEAGEVIARLKVHLFRKKIRPIYKEVKKIEFSSEKFIVQAASSLYQSDFLIIATGTAPREPDCQIPLNCRKKVLFQLPEKLPVNKAIAIIGCGDAAFDYALNLSRFNTVLLFCRSKQFKAHRKLTEQAQKQKRIKIFSEMRLTAIRQLKNRQFSLSFQTPVARQEFRSDAIIFAIGRRQQIPVFNFDHQNELLKNRLFFCGDVQNELCRQLTIALGDGVRAAQKIYLQIRSVQ